jgi:outer membrane protein, adhesin transport system
MLWSLVMRIYRPRIRRTNPRVMNRPSFKRPFELSTLSSAVVLVATMIITQSAAAQNDANGALADVARRALASSPDVAARLNALRGAADAVDVVRGGLLPRVDADAAVGRTSDRLFARSPERQNLDYHGAALSATQLLWDGGALFGEIGRLGHERLVRWFEFLDISEQTSLEAVRAYQDVLRFRRLLSLAEDSYVQHKVLVEQMRSRVQAGVGRGSDLQQANARLALSESNIATEAANLHDAAARFHRIVGEVPATNLPTPASLDGSMPPQPQVAIDTAIKHNAAISASVEGMRATRESLRNRRAGYQPKVEARVRSGTGRNFDGVADQKTDTSAQLVLNWNLYAGGSDQARVRQASSLMQQAADLRDKTCRDVRQVAAVAYNDTQRLSEQLVSLERNTVAILRARDAYRQQFDIGQRSLLDLLNSENEAYTARRAVVNARVDMNIAQARTLASMQRLNSTLGVARASEAGPEPQAWELGADAPGRCPVLVAMNDSAVPKAELDARAQRIIQSAPAAAPTAQEAPAPVPAAAPPAPNGRRQQQKR